MFLPMRWATKRAKPIASGAMKDVRLFSTANMMIVMISSAVRIISRKSPCAIVAPEERAFSACSGPGSSADTKPAAAMPPTNCIGTTQTRRTQSNAPAIQSAKDTYHLISFSKRRKKGGRGVERGEPCTAYCRIEHSSTNTVKDPNIYTQAHSKHGTDV